MATTTRRRGSVVQWFMALALVACVPDPVAGSASRDAPALDGAVGAQGDGARDAAVVPDATLGDVTADARVEDDVGAVDVVMAADRAAPEDAGGDVGSAPAEAGAVDAGPVDAGPVPAVTGVPRIDAELKAAMRAVYLRGVAAGLRAGVFAKVGDSLTESASFLADFGPASGTPSWDLGGFTALDPTRAYFDATLVDLTHSSFDRPSLAAVAGWTTGHCLEDGGALLRQELAELRPAIAVVMFGSADVDVITLEEFRANLTRIVQVVLAAQTIPVLSTIPDRTDTPTTTTLGPSFNGVIREVAAAQHVPLADYWTALLPLPQHGVSDDGVHPSIYRRPGGLTEAAFFTPEALAYGYNVRNLLTLATLAHLRAVVLDDGPADR